MQEAVNKAEDEKAAIQPMVPNVRPAGPVQGGAQHGVAQPQPQAPHPLKNVIIYLKSGRRNASVFFAFNFFIFCWTADGHNMIYLLPKYSLTVKVHNSVERNPHTASAV